MRRLAAVPILLLVVAPMAAQAPKANADPLLQLLGSKAVRKELGLSAEQVEAIEKAPARVLERFKDDREGIDRDLEKFNRQSTEFIDDADHDLLAAASKGLLPPQAERLSQLRVQHLGVWAFADSRIKLALKLSEKQSEEIGKLQDQFQQDLRDLPDRVGRQAQKDNVDYAKLLETEHAALLRGAIEKMAATLDADQQKRWHGLVGEPPAARALQLRRPDDSLVMVCTVGRIILCFPLLIKAELKTGDETVRRLQTVVQEAADKKADEWGKMQQQALDLAQRETDLQARMFSAYRELARKELLRPAQWARVEQIEHQMAGIDLLLGPLAKDLALTDEQKKQIRALRRDLGRAGRELAEKGFQDRLQAVRAVQEVNRQGTAGLERILDADQKVVWAQAVGLPFDFTAIDEVAALGLPTNWLLPPEQEAQHRAAQHLRQKEYPQAIAAMEEAIELTPKEPWVYNTLAFFLATCKDDKVRDGKRAAKLATQALLLKPDEGEFMDTLAAAEAELGNWDSAIELVNKAIARGRPARKPAYEARLKLYKEKKPYRE